MTKPEDAGREDCRFRFEVRAGAPSGAPAGVVEATGDGAFFARLAEAILAEFRDELCAEVRAGRPPEVKLNDEPIGPDEIARRAERT